MFRFGFICFPAFPILNSLAFFPLPGTASLRLISSASVRTPRTSLFHFYALSVRPRLAVLQRHFIRDEADSRGQSLLLGHSWHLTPSALAPTAAATIHSSSADQMITISSSKPRSVQTTSAAGRDHTSAAARGPGANTLYTLSPPCAACLLIFFVPLHIHIMLLFSSLFAQFVPSHNATASAATSAGP